MSFQDIARKGSPNPNSNGRSNGTAYGNSSANNKRQPSPSVNGIRKQSNTSPALPHQSTPTMGAATASSTFGSNSSVDTRPPTGVPTAGDQRTARLSDSLMQYSQNVAILHRIVQSLGGVKDTEELRGQYTCQFGVVADIRRKIEEELARQRLEIDAEDMSRQEAARLRATHAKLTKDLHRVSGILTDLETEATHRMEELDRKHAENAAYEAALAARLFGNSDRDGSGRYTQNTQMQTQIQAQKQAQIQEEAVNQAIIEETEAELTQINKSLHVVHEIFKDLAGLVSQQQEQVDMIEVTTESAHQRAQQGLAQVQKASHYQPGCSVS